MASALVVRRRIDRLDIRAPVAGVVLGLHLTTPRAVLRAAEPVLSIVPQDRPLVIQAQISPLHIDEVHVGQRVRLVFPAFSARTTPELNGKLNGHAVRAPVLNASLTDCVFEMKRETSAEEVNALFAAAAQGPLAGILGYEARPLVSVDYARDTRSAIVDALSTLVTDGTMLKVYAWYDNEMGYACRMVDLACHMNEVGL